MPLCHNGMALQEWPEFVSEQLVIRFRQRSEWSKFSFGECGLYWMHYVSNALNGWIVLEICSLQLLCLILEKCPSIWWMSWNTHTLFQMYLWFLATPLNKAILSFLDMIIPFRLYIKPCSLQLLYDAPGNKSNNNQLEDEIIVGNMISATTRRLPRSEAHFSYHLSTAESSALMFMLPCSRRFSYGLVVVTKKTLRSV